MCFSWLIVRASCSPPLLWPPSVGSFFKLFCYHFIWKFHPLHWILHDHDFPDTASSPWQFHSCWVCIRAYMQIYKHMHHALKIQTFIISGWEGWGDWGMRSKRYMASFGDDKDVLSWLYDGCTNSENMLTIIYLYMLNGRIAWYVNNTSIKLLQNLGNGIWDPWRDDWLSVWDREKH